MHKAGPATVGPAGSTSPVLPRPARRPTVWPRRTSRTSAPPSRGRLGALPRELPPTPRDYCRQAPTAAGLGMLPPTPSADSATLPMNLPMASLRNVLTGGHATRIQRTSAQARTSENRMSVLLIRRFRVRSPDAPRVLTCGYASFKSRRLAWSGPRGAVVRPRWIGAMCAPGGTRAACRKTLRCRQATTHSSSGCITWPEIAARAGSRPEYP